MKKHRNFLTFYALWLGVIFLAFTVFETDRDQNRIPIEESKAICKLAKKPVKHSKWSQCDERGVAN